MRQSADQMPVLGMKTKVNTDSLREKYGLPVCQKSCMISKRSSSHIRISQEVAELNVSVKHYNCETAESINLKLLLNEDSELQQQQFISMDSTTEGRTESAHLCTSNLETIFSPLDAIEFRDGLDAGDRNGVPDVSMLGADNDDDRSAGYNQACSVSDFFISDMIIASIPCNANAIEDNMTGVNPFPDLCSEPSMVFDIAEQYMLLPLLEDSVKANDMHDESSEEIVMAEDCSSLHVEVEEMRSCNQESDVNSNPDEPEDFDPQSFIKNLSELSDVPSNFSPDVMSMELQRRKSVTLVLDLDETLVHSTLEHCEDSDFTFTVFFNDKEHTVYVKKRPYLHTFLTRVAEMFEVIVFTASQSIYAEQLLDILDPDQKLLSRRIYRESCILSDGTYTKDLTILGTDLAKVAIVDNSPQVFRLQVNNGIPITSWYNDPSDCALISLLPFLENLVDADDVRPIIAKRFGNEE